jgi:preprotein translocase subunit SecG
MLSNLLMVFLFLTALFLILLVLVQRGKGGGLAGAFGGMGGQSAFGTKAGDMFTKITVVVVAIWIVLNVISPFALESSGKSLKNIEKAPDASAGIEGTAAPGDSTSGSDAPSDG